MKIDGDYRYEITAKEQEKITSELEEALILSRIDNQQPLPEAIALDFLKNKTQHDIELCIAKHENQRASINMNSLITTLPTGFLTLLHSVAFPGTPFDDTQSCIGLGIMYIPYITLTFLDTPVLELRKTHIYIKTYLLKKHLHKIRKKHTTPQDL